MPTYNDALETYIRQTFAVEDEALVQIRERIKAEGLPTITVKPEEGRFLQFLVAACGARLAVEIGTLGGYSGTWIARGLPSEGRLITLEVEPKRAEVARESFRLAGVFERVDLRVGNAHDLMPTLRAEGPFDFVFIDAEKEGYLAYLEWALTSLRPGGILAAHNAFRHGAVADPGDRDPGTEVIRRFNRKLSEDSRWIPSVYPAGDGMAVAVFRG